LNAIRSAIEGLESRVLLTVLVGGDVFQWQDANGNVAQINMNGSKLSADFVLGYVDDQNNTIITDLPGHFVASPLDQLGADVLGGVGAQDGIEPVSLDSVGGAPTTFGQFPAAPSAADLEALASRSNGQTWGINLATVVLANNLKQQQIQLVSLNNQTGAGVVTSDLRLSTDAQGNPVLPRDPNAATQAPANSLSTVTSVPAAAFSPINGRLYFVAVDNTPKLAPVLITPIPGQPAPPTPPTPPPSFPTPRLYSVDVDTGQVFNEGGTFAFGTTSAGNFANVSDIAFDSRGNLWAFLVRGGTGSIAQINPSGGLGATLNVSLDNKNVNNITGLAFVQGNPDLPEDTYVLGVTNAQTDVSGGPNETPNASVGATTTVPSATNSGQSPQLLRIRLSSGTAISMGGVIDKQDPHPIANNPKPKRGLDIGDMTWNPLLSDPFTNQPGVLMVTDVGSDDLCFIDSRMRPPSASIFSIQVNQSSITDSISISAVSNNGAPLTAFTGNAGPLRVQDGNTGLPIIINSPAGAGALYLGARTKDISVDPNDDQIPILGTTMDRPVSSFRAGSITPGLQVTGAPIYSTFNTSFAGSMLGANLDRITGMAIAPDGTIAVMDSDLRNAQGDLVQNDELALIDRTTNQAFAGAGIVLASTGAPLRDVQGMDYADLNGDGIPELYAIYNVGGATTLGTIIDNPSSPEFGHFIPIGTLTNIANVTAMAFAPDKKLWVVNDTNGLIQVNPQNGAPIRVIDTLTDPSTGQNLAVNSMDFTTAGTLLAHDVTNARLVDIDVTNARVGTVVKTPAGSLPITFLAIEYDPTIGKLLAVDSGASATDLQRAFPVTVLNPTVDEGSSNESAMLDIIDISAATGAQKPQDFGSFLFGGTFTGTVNVPGSMQTLYAGWLLAGQSSGMANKFSFSVIGDGVFGAVSIGGDIATIASLGTIGSDSAVGGPALHYSTGFNVHVGGQLGQIISKQDFVGTVNVDNDPNSPDMPASVGQARGTGGGTFAGGFLTGSPAWDSQDFSTPQFVGTLNNNDPDRVEIDGIALQSPTSVPPAPPPPAITADWYAIPLLAGQTVTVELDSPGSGVRVGVYDPDNRLIATDFSNNDAGEVNGRPFQFIAEKAGSYRIAAGADPGFTRSGADNYLALRIPYHIVLTGVGTNIGGIPIGGIVAAGNILDPTDDRDGFQTPRGDIGSIWAGGNVYVTPKNNTGGAFWAIANTGNKPNNVPGNIREIQGGSVSAPLALMNGSIGFIHATTGSIDIETDKDHAIGRDIQIIDAATTVDGLYYVDAAMGTIRGDIVSGTYNLNWDQVGTDGTIDLIDATTELFAPLINTGPGGNVRYIKAPLDGVIRPGQFGGGTPEATGFDIGEVVNLTDDSGGLMTFAPLDVQVNPAFDPSQPVSDTNSQFVGPRITDMLTYPISGSAGVVVISFSVDGPLQITGTNTGLGGSVEIGQITDTGTGRPVVRDETTNKLVVQPPPPATTTTTTTTSTTPVAPTPSTDLRIGVDGGATVDVLSISGTGDFTSIVNNTPNGEIANLDVGDVGTLSGDFIGIMKKPIGVAVNARTVATDTFPFNQQHNLINIGGNVISIQANKSLGNIEIGGDVGLIQANADGRDDPAVFEGINGPIVGLNTTLAAVVDTTKSEPVGATPPPAPTEAHFTDVQIGEGVLPSGSGDLADAGVFAAGPIDLVEGHNADIRGDIVSLSHIGSVDLTNGWIINQETETAETYEQTREWQLGGFLPEPGDQQGVNHPGFDIESIRASGIMGSVFAASDVGPISANFAFFDSIVGVVGDGRIDKITVGGYGIRDVTLFGGASDSGFNATGNGSLLSTDQMSSDVRLSESEEFDPYFHFIPNKLTDIHATLGTSAAAPNIAGRTDTGIIENVDARGSRDLGPVSAYQIRSTDPVNSPTTFNFANSITSITTRSIINGLQVSTGRLNAFTPANDIFNLNMVIAGPIKKMNVNGTVGGSSVISAVGPNGSIGKLTIARDMVGDISATNSIKTVRIGGALSGKIKVIGTARKGGSVGNVFIGGRMTNGGLDVNGDVGKVQLLGGLGNPGDMLHVTGTIQYLRVGGDLASSLQIDNSIKRLDVFGSILSGVTIQVNNQIGSLFVTGDVQAGATIRARQLKKLRVIGANNGTYQIG
jgi:hypothetical protein